MIVGGYLLDLYCDVPGCTAHKRVGAEDTRRSALKIARKRGWVVNTASGFVKCPSHKYYREYETNEKARNG